MENNIFRITDYSVVRFYYTIDSEIFNIVENSSGDKQYLGNEESIINSTVWFDSIMGLQTKHRLNKTFDSLPLIQVFDKQEILGVRKLEILLRQGYIFTDKFGLLIVVKTLNTNETLISKIVYESDFKLTSKLEFINGSWWSESVILNIPDIDELLSIEIVEVKLTDIDPIGENIGLIYNYPTDLVPLIPEKPIPDYIQNYLKQTDNLFFEFGVQTTENKTIEQSILDYFDQEIADIQVNHILTYGDENTGYKKLTLSNSTNKYLPIIVGLDFSTWSVDSDITVHLSTQILVDGKLMQRDISIIINVKQLLQPYIADMIVHPTTNYPVEIKNEIINNQTIIETSEKIKVVKLYESLFAEIVEFDFVYDTKNITFNGITNNCYLQIGDNVLDSQITSDNVIYFDLSLILPITEDTKYSIRTYETNMLIREGNIKTK